MHFRYLQPPDRSAMSMDRIQTGARRDDDLLRGSCTAREIVTLGRVKQIQESIDWDGVGRRALTWAIGNEIS